MLNAIFFASTAKERLLPLRDFVLAIIISLGLSAVQLIPTLELKRLSLRFRPLTAIEMTALSMTMSDFNKEYLLSNLGLLPLILFPIGIMRIKSDKRILFYTLLLLLFFVLSLGKTLPPVYNIYKVLAYLPGFNWFRYCARYIYIAIFFMVLISAKGLDFILDIISKIKMPHFLQLGLKCIIAVAIPFLLFIDLFKRQEIITVNSAGIASTVCYYDKLKYSDYLNISEGPLVRLLRQIQEENKLMRVATDFNLPENILSQFNIPSFCLRGGVYTPLNLLSLERLAYQAPLLGRYEILDLLGINYFVSYDKIAFPSNDWELVFRGIDSGFNRITYSILRTDEDRSLKTGEIFVFKNKMANLRIFMLSNLRDDYSYYSQTKETNGIVTLKYDIEVIEYSPDRVILRTNQNKDAFLVMNDMHYPGWKAYIDRRKAKIHLTNAICRGIFLKEGKHFIEFKYDPFSFRIGLYISLITILTVLFFAMRHNLKLVTSRSLNF